MAGPELLILARHATPQRTPTVAAREWPLTPAGELDARRLGDRWGPLGIEIVVSSLERKAIATATIAADRLGTMFQTGHDLHEHERPYVDDRATFERTMQEFFADAAQHAAVEARFTKAVDALVRVHRGHRLAIVTHGTVMSLHLAARYGLDGWKTWNRLGMPAYAVLETRTKTLVDLVDNV